MFRRRRLTSGRSDAIFADDLLAACDNLYRSFPGEVLTLPISIPIGSDGRVRLQPAGPVDAPRVASTMIVTRPTPGVYGIRIERADGQPIRLPGVNDGEPVTGLTIGITRLGLHITDVQAPLRFDEDTACALANAVMITIHMKLIKAQSP